MQVDNPVNERWQEAAKAVLPADAYEKYAKDGIADDATNAKIAQKAGELMLAEIGGGGSGGSKTKEPAAGVTKESHK